ncbi:heparinase II/III family protein [Pedobacter sp. HDW13]|uniref:heparinase II/III family protein n=1 Tax=Pedobacter sp. HDW13 TaxID=2714940 RepID=UPI00210436A9|nr:heparinase II/III family protein [Pedobacter sp. HDW13]
MIRFKAKIFFCAFLLSGTLAKAQSNISKESFDLINLGYPGLEQVKKAVEAGQYEEAGKVLLRYYRNKLGAKPDLSNLETPIDTGKLALKLKKLLIMP